MSLIKTIVIIIYVFFTSAISNISAEEIKKNCPDQLKSIREFNSSAINMGITCPVLSSNLAYYDQMFSNHKIGEIIQLQRSFFGLHPIKDKKGKNKINPYWTKL